MTDPQGLRLGRAAHRGRRQQVALARSMYEDAGNKPHDICHAFKISRATLYRCLRPRAAARNKQNLPSAPEATSTTMLAAGKSATAEEKGLV